MAKLDVNTMGPERERTRGSFSQVALLGAAQQRESKVAALNKPLGHDSPTN